MRTNYLIQDLLYGNYWSEQRQDFFGITLASQYNSLREAKADTSVLTLKSYEALEKLAEGQSTKIIVPSDMQNIATFGTVINEMIDKKK